ncbi:hypothetical protein COCON_G00120880 [Conger conger]|uniref:Uncharacterized protein n=1 Tax=Conger conger TaxID=82655 RepID=A0A9Q1DH31_CONCO|nr:hypothetical protein COCON_G00120880 [Conger conger]
MLAWYLLSEGVKLTYLTHNVIVPVFDCTSEPRRFQHPLPSSSWCELLLPGLAAGLNTTSNEPEYRAMKEGDAVVRIRDKVQSQKAEGRRSLTETNTYLFREPGSHQPPGSGRRIHARLGDLVISSDTRVRQMKTDIALSGPLSLS